MKIFHGTNNANILRGTVLTLGVFDGLHLGHQKIMETVVSRAKIVGAVPTAITLTRIRVRFFIPKTRRRCCRRLTKD